MSALVIQEAFAAGIPVLATNVYGNAEQIQHNHNGLLFQFNNVEDLRTQILRCINEPDLINNLAKNIKTPRSFEEVAEEYYTLYKNLLN
jgi:glycosyltransferase involved in cell wall biosynthesis